MERENFRSQTPDNPGAANSKQDNINMLLNALSSKDWVKLITYKILSATHSGFLSKEPAV